MKVFRWLEKIRHGKCDSQDDQTHGKQYLRSRCHGPTPSLNHVPWRLQAPSRSRSARRIYLAILESRNVHRSAYACRGTREIGGESRVAEQWILPNPRPL